MWREEAAGKSTETAQNNTTEIDCDWYFSVVYDSYHDIYVPELAWACQTVTTTTPGGLTQGKAITRLKWGATPTVPSLYGSGPVSTQAFRPNNLTPCNPVSDIQPDAPCSNAIDSNYVEDAGYETKIVIDDPTCQRDRSSPATDIYFDCFVPSTIQNGGWSTTLPAPYLDTQFLDDKEEFIASIGTREPQNIQEGATHLTSLYFASRGSPNMNGKNARHIGSITTELELHPLCVIVPTPAFCYFGVDTASVGGDFTQFSENTLPGGGLP